MREPILAAVGDLQFEVVKFRLAREFDCDLDLVPLMWERACIVDREQTAKLRGTWGIDLVEDTDGRPVALFRSERIMRAAVEEPSEIASARPHDQATP